MRLHVIMHASDVARTAKAQYVVFASIAVIVRNHHVYHAATHIVDVIINCNNSVMMMMSASAVTGMLHDSKVLLLLMRMLLNSCLRLEGLRGRCRHRSCTRTRSDFPQCCCCC